jgi:hypothetical protein
MTGRSRTARWLLILVAAAACVNLAAGLTIALRDPARASDLRTMYDWCRAWLIDGQSLYTGPEAATDYPPNAIALLSPLALVPPGWLVPLWAACAVALAPVLPWIVLRCASRPGREPLAMVVPALLYLCWAAPRTLLQFSVLSLTLAFAAVLLVDRRRLAGGAVLGLALFKPHIAAPVALWMLVSGRLRPLIAAAAVVCLGVAVYDARIGERPLTTAAGWWTVIGSEYGGSDGLVGHTSIRAWVQIAVRNPVAADVTWIAVSLLILIGLCGIAMRDRSRALDEGGMAIPAMFCLWSLLVTYHNGNNLILMLPAFAFLWFHVDRQASAMRWIPIAVLQAALAFDVPVRLHGLAPGLGVGGVVIEHFDRILVLAALSYVVVAWWRLTRSSWSG